VKHHNSGSMHFCGTESLSRRSAGLEASLWSCMIFVLVSSFVTCLYLYEHKNLLIFTIWLYKCLHVVHEGQHPVHELHFQRRLHIPTIDFCH